MEKVGFPNSILLGSRAFIKCKSLNCITKSGLVACEQESQSISRLIFYIDLLQAAAKIRSAYKKQQVASKQTSLSPYVNALCFVHHPLSKLFCCCLVYYHESLFLSTLDCLHVLIFLLSYCLASYLVSYICDLIGS